MYLQYHASKKEADNTILFYAICVLYILCGTMISVDVAASVIRDVSNNDHLFLMKKLCANQSCRSV